MAGFCNSLFQDGLFYVLCLCHFHVLDGFSLFLICFYYRESFQGGLIISVVCFCFSVVFRCIFMRC